LHGVRKKKKKEEGVLSYRGEKNKEGIYLSAPNSGFLRLYVKKSAREREKKRA